jgi:hypothetical protein
VVGNATTTHLVNKTAFFFSLSARGEKGHDLRRDSFKYSDLQNKIIERGSDKKNSVALVR